MRKIKNQLIINLVILIAPLVLALLSYNFYGLSMINNHVASAGLSVLETYSRILEQDLQLAQDYLINKLYNDSDTLSLNYADSYLDSYLIGENILSDFEQFMYSGFDSIYAMAVYAENQDMLRICYHNYDASITYEDNSKLKQELLWELKQSGPYEWRGLQMEKKDLLISTMHNGNVHFAVVVDLEKAKSPQKYDTDAQQGYLVYADKSGNPVTLKEFIQKNHIQIKFPNKPYYFTGDYRNRFIVVYKALQNGNLMQLYLQPYTLSLYAIDYTQAFLFLLTVAVAVLLPVGYQYMRKNYISPVENLVKTMVEIKDGDSEKYLAEEYRVEEFTEMKETFNTMLESIRNLKVSAYEQQLQAQEAKLQYLQIQIRPHFYLNCLKNLYALSASGENRKLQRMILVLSEYMRGIIRENENLVTIEDEVKSIKNYLELQQMSLSNPPDYRIDVDSSLKYLKIPPMAILTFVENSVKYGMHEQKKLIISVRVSLLSCEHENYVSITVLDSGPGFAEEVLSTLNQKDGKLQKEHIGIDNVKQRIQMLYHSRATIFFSNSDGACVEMILPVQEGSSYDSTYR